MTNEQKNRQYTAASDINVMSINSEMMGVHWVKRGEIAWDRFSRVVRCALAIFGHKRLDFTDKDRLMTKFMAAGVGDTIVDISPDGNHIVLTGSFNINKLRGGILW